MIKVKQPCRALVLTGLFWLLPWYSIFAQFDITTFEPATPQQFAGFGRSIAAIGDVNNDAVSDLIVGAPTEDVGGTVDVGRVYVVSGATGLELYALDTPNPQQFGIFGFNLAAADLTNDGVADLIVGCSEDLNALSGAGRVYVFNGADGTPLYDIVSPDPQEFAWFSRSLATLDDVNNDGINDFAVGSIDPVGTIIAAGKVHVFSGTDGSFLFTISSPNPNAMGQFGLTMASIDDINNDGISDLLIGTEETPDTLAQAGRAYAFSGADGTLIHTLGSQSPEIQGRFGWSVNGAGDVTGDGIEDLIVGSQEDVGGFFDAGRAYLFDGSTGAFLYNIVSPNPFHVDWFSRSLATAGDITGDNKADLVISAPFADIGSSFDAGKVYFFSGENGSFLDSLQSPDPEFEGLFGFALIGNWNDNQTADIDIITSAYLEDIDTVLNAGKVHRFVSQDVAIDVPAAQFPNSMQLHQNYPNPFNPLTTIEFELPLASAVTLNIYDILGRHVTTSYRASLPAGTHQFLWNATDVNGNPVSSGIYYYRLTNADKLSITRKMILIR